MSEENAVEENSNPSLEGDDVSLEDIFNSFDNDVGMTSHREGEPKEDKKEVDEKPNKTEEKEATKDEEETKDEDTGENKDEDVKKEKDEAVERLEKRLADTRKAFERSNQANQKVLEKVANGEALTEEDLKSLASEAPDSADGIAKLVQEVNDGLPIAKAVVIQMSGKTEAEIDADVEAFNELANVDTKLIAQLQDTPISERAAFVIKRGGELRGVFETVKEHGGSVTAALSDIEAVSTRKLNKIKADVRVEIEKEYKEKYKDYVVSSRTSTKFSSSGSNVEKPSSNSIDYSGVSMSDILE